jgi:hypothetical protein
MLETQVPVTELEQLYTLRKADEVIGYIRENPHLLPFLKFAPDLIKKYFPKAPLFLTLFIDPDNLTDRYLTIYIGTNYNVDETLARLYELEDEWFFYVIEKTNRKLTILIEFL